MNVNPLANEGKELQLFLYRAGRRLFSRQAWVVLSKSLDERSAEAVPEGIELKEAQECDIERIADALPDELAGRLTHEKRVAMVRSRFKAGVPCVIAVNSTRSEVLGGCWCRPLARGHGLRALLPGWSNVFEVSTLFVTPEARGKSIGTVLMRRACSFMRENGFQGCVSLVWYTRQPSIKSHLKLGFQPVGEKVTASVLGFRKTWFRSQYRSRALPQFEGQSS